MAISFLTLLLAACCPWLLQTLDFLASHSDISLNLHRAASNVHETADPKPVTMDNAVMRRGVDEVAIASTASTLALDSSKDAFTVRQTLIGSQAVSVAEANYLKVRPMLPAARAQLLTVRKFTMKAWQHMKHAREVLTASKSIAHDAAEKALEAVKGWIKSDAAASAEVSATKDNRGDRLAAAVAGAVEPYHLALLRNQKFCAETYAKAKSAQASAVKLITDAKKLALKAQEMQAGGMIPDAQQTLAIANGMMSQADELRQWGNKLYGQANTACGTAGGYEMLEQQAAANAAATTIMNAPMKLPPKKR